MAAHDLLDRSTTTLVPEPDPPPARLSSAECHRRLAGEAVARLGFETGRGRRRVVVGYVLGRGDEVLLLLPEYHPAVGYLAGAPVTLELEVAVEGGWDAVCATGTASVDPPASDLRAGGAGWPPGVAVHQAHVRITRLYGVRRLA